MNHYFVYGGCLRSQLEFPELSPARKRSRQPDWTLRVERTEPPEGPRLRGEREVAPGWTMRLRESPDRLRLEFGAAGCYDLLDEARVIVWYPGEGAPLMLVRSVVLGPVMALSLSSRGLLCLHGSAAAIDGGVVAFLAPKFCGKSTLALMLTAAGARLVTDDMVALHPGPPATVHPGVHSVRLLPDAAERLRARIPGTMVQGLKPTVTQLPDSLLAWESRPLETLYLLEPTLSDGGPAVIRSRVPPAEAAAALAVHSKLPDPLVGLSSAAVALRRIAAVVRATHVYRLRTVRNVDRLNEVTGQLLEWHRASPNSARPRP